MTPTRLAASVFALLAFTGIAQAGQTPIPIPEPSTMAVLAAGIAGLALAMRFRKRK